MNERDTDCEENCFLFKAIPEEQINLNRRARQASQNGEEFPGSPNTLCGGCVKIKTTDSYLNKKISELLNHEN
jgi:hypothetical protein